MVERWPKTVADIRPPATQRYAATTNRRRNSDSYESTWPLSLDALGEAHLAS